MTKIPRPRCDRRTRTRRRLGTARALPLALALALVGCRPRPPLGEARGEVTFRGSPLQAGSVIFANDEAGASYVSPIAEDGTFRFGVAAGYGLPPGTYQVAVGPPHPGPTLASGDPPAPPRTAPMPEIPPRYRDPAASGLTVTVREGDNPPFRIDLR